MVLFSFFLNSEIEPDCINDIWRFKESIMFYFQRVLISENLTLHLFVADSRDCGIYSTGDVSFKIISTLGIL